MVNDQFLNGIPRGFHALIIIFSTMLAFVGCSSHFSTLKSDETTDKIIYAIPEDKAFQIAYYALATTLPGRKITEIEGPVRGYSTYFRFVADTYTQQVLIFPALGATSEGLKIKGYYFEVSGSGSSFVQGRAKNTELFERLSADAQATGKAVSVVSVETRQYESAKMIINQSQYSNVESKDDIIKRLEQLKKLRDQGVITDQDFEQKKKELLDRL